MISRRTIFVWGAAIAALVLIGLYVTPSTAPPLAGAGGGAMRRMPPPPPDLRTLLRLLGVGSTIWYACVASLPVLTAVAAYTQRFHGRRWRVALTCILAALGLALAATTIEYFVSYRGATLRPPYLSFFTLRFGRNALPFAALMGIAMAIEARRHAARATIEAERLRAAMAEARLAALTTQLEPHFLFNTLQSISTLIHRDPAAADEMLGKLSDLLHELLRERDTMLVPLDDELRFVNAYLDIARVRFGERLSVHVDAPAAVRDALVPLFILQPLVENTLRHGIGGRARGGRISITATASGGRLVMEVSDDGAGLGQGSIQSANGIGLTNTRERLRSSFGDDHSLALVPRDGGGVIARIDVPLVRRPSPPPV